MTQQVNIGKSVHIKGELTGNEDLTIDGKVEGKIILKDHTLRIGANGRVTADIQAKDVVVAGELIGNVTADTRVEIAASGSMEGDIKAPRLVLADGGRFKGGVDMAPKEAGSVARPFGPKEGSKPLDNQSKKSSPNIAEQGKNQ